MTDEELIEAAGGLWEQAIAYNPLMGTATDPCIRGVADTQRAALWEKARQLDAPYGEAVVWCISKSWTDSSYPNAKPCNMATLNNFVIRYNTDR
jgi:hypothetical protein